MNQERDTKGISETVFPTIHFDDSLFSVKIK